MNEQGTELYEEDIDVAAIMREIRDSIVPEEEGLFISDEVDRINQFLENTRHDMSEHLSVGMTLPPVSNRHNPVMRKLIVFARKVVRKLCKFLIGEQIIVNEGGYACVKALSEKDEAIYIESSRQINELRNEVERLRREVESLKRERIGGHH